jgi:hypothetical protein
VDEDLVNETLGEALLVVFTPKTPMLSSAAAEVV